MLTVAGCYVTLPCNIPAQTWGRGLRRSSSVGIKIRLDYRRLDIISSIESSHCKSMQIKFQYLMFKQVLNFSKKCSLLFIHLSCVYLQCLRNSLIFFSSVDIKYSLQNETNLPHLLCRIVYGDKRKLSNYTLKILKFMPILELRSSKETP